QEADDRRLLRARRERPRGRRAAKQRDELAASHGRPQGVKNTHRIVSQPSGSWNGARGMRTATNCSGLGMSVLGPTTGQNRKKAQNEQMFPALPPTAGLTILEFLPPSALCERRHLGLAL